MTTLHVRGRTRSTPPSSRSRSCKRVEVEHRLPAHDADPRRHERRRRRAASSGGRRIAVAVRRDDAARRERPRLPPRDRAAHRRPGGRRLDRARRSPRSRRWRPRPTRCAPRSSARHDTRARRSRSQLANGPCSGFGSADRLAAKWAAAAAVLADPARGRRERRSTSALPSARRRRPARRRAGDGGVRRPGRCRQTAAVAADDNRPRRDSLDPRSRVHDLILKLGSRPASQSLNRGAHDTADSATSVAWTRDTLTARRTRP